MNENVKTSISDQIAEVTLDRPEKLNALTWGMFEGLAAAADSIHSNNKVRAVVLYGSGGNFCSGLDLSIMKRVSQELASGDKALFEPRGADSMNAAQAPAYSWKKLSVPVIAAIEGMCFGGGLQIALGADIRIAHPESKLSVMEVKWGLIPDMSASQTLRTVVGQDVAKLLTFTARVVTGKEALRLGLVTDLSTDPLGAARDVAREIASRSPDAVRAAKRLLEEAWHEGPQYGLQLEARLQKALIGSVNQMKAVRVGMEKSTPQFTDGELDIGSI